MAPSKLPAMLSWVEQLKLDDLPKTPFTLSPGMEVLDGQRFLTALKADAAIGGDSPRIRSGAFAQDCVRLKQCIQREGKRPPGWQDAELKPSLGQRVKRAAAKAQAAKANGAGNGPAAAKGQYQPEQAQIASKTNLPANPVLVAFDFETTGLTPSKDDIIEFGAIKFTPQGEELDQFQELCNPGYAVPKEVTEVTQITTKMLKKAAPPKDVLIRWLDWLGPDAVLVAHNAPFDAEFLRASCERYSVPEPDIYVVDTLKWTRQLKLDTPDYKLGTLLEHFGLAGEGQLHRSLVDAKGVMDLCVRIAGQNLNPIEEILPQCYRLRDNKYIEFRRNRRG